MRITCAISGIRFDCAHLESMSITQAVGYYHPIFAVPQHKLYHLYRDHCHGKLTPTDSYLLFLCFLNATNKIDWQHPAICDPKESRTKAIVQNNLAQIIRVLEKTAVIKHPSFTQPSFKMTLDTAHLEQIPNWIKAWEKNIVSFNTGQLDIRTRRSILDIESKLSKLIQMGESPESYSHVIASWAAEAATFPADKTELYQKTIRSCFNMTKMFNTPLPLLKEIKEFCECNVEPGSIYSHALFEVIKEGISRHVDYLGGSSLALGYTILPTLGTGTIDGDKKMEDQNKLRLLELAEKAPDKAPVSTDYPNTLDFVKAKLAFRVANNIAKQERIEKEAELKRLERTAAEEAIKSVAKTSIVPKDIDIEDSL